ncbi:exported hypothetical protein [Mesorhizobium sp. SOD10]|nr:exported hypothetical protein [Mesorhizobium sp. SOD10]
MFRSATLFASNMDLAASGISAQAKDADRTANKTAARIALSIVIALHFMTRRAYTYFDQAEMPAGKIAGDPLQPAGQTVYTGRKWTGPCRTIRLPINCHGCRAC